MGNCLSNNKNESTPQTDPKTDIVIFDPSNFKIVGMISTTNTKTNTKTNSELIINYYNNKFEIYIKTTKTTKSAIDKLIEQSSYISIESYINSQGIMYKNSPIQIDKKSPIQTEITAYDFSEGKSPYPQIHIFDYDTYKTDMEEIKFTYLDENNKMVSSSLAEQINQTEKDKIYLSFGGSVEWIYDKTTKQTNPKIFGMESATYSKPDNDLKRILINDKTTFVCNIDWNIVPKSVIPNTFDIMDIYDKNELIIDSEKQTELQNFIDTDNEIQKLLFDLNYMELVKKKKELFLLGKTDLLEKNTKTLEVIIDNIRSIITGKTSINYEDFMVFEIIGLLYESYINNNFITEKKKLEDKKTELETKKTELETKKTELEKLYDQYDKDMESYYIIKNYIYNNSYNITTEITNFLTSIDQSFDNDTIIDKILSKLLSYQEPIMSNVNKQIEDLTTNCNELLKKINQSETAEASSRMTKIEQGITYPIYKLIIVFEIIKQVKNADRPESDTKYSLPPFYPEKDTMREIIAKFSKPSIKPFKPVNLKDYFNAYKAIVKDPLHYYYNDKLIIPKAQIKNYLNEYKTPIYSSYNDGISDDDNHLIINNDGIGYIKRGEIIAYVKDTYLIDDSEKDKISTIYNLNYRVKWPNPVIYWPHPYFPQQFGEYSTKYFDIEESQDVLLSRYVYHPFIYGDTNNYLIKIGKNWSQSFMHKFINRTDRMTVVYDVKSTNGITQYGNLYHNTTPPNSTNKIRNIMIIFEGSVDYTDWLSDALVFSVNTQIGKVHFGFWIKFSVHHDQIFKSLEISSQPVNGKNELSTPFDKIIFGGHSMGGSIAQIACAYFKKLLPNTNFEVVTQGAPCPFKSPQQYNRIHNRYAAYTHDEAWWIPDTLDPVPDILSSFGYRHDSLGFVDKNGRKLNGTFLNPCREVKMRDWGDYIGSYYDKNTEDITFIGYPFGFKADHPLGCSYIPKILHAYCGAIYDAEYEPKYNQLLNRKPGQSY
jgi:hypothetical protein